MRIWSKKLIPVLPDKQLKAMRYELGDMIKQYPNIKHGLVKFANDYDIYYLYYYFADVICIMASRNINMNENYNYEIFKIFSKKTKEKKFDIAQFNEDNEEYLKICYCNLYEKHLRKMITDEEWQKIEDLFKEIK